MMNIKILIHFESMETGDEHFEVVLGVLVVENEVEMKIKILLLALARYRSTESMATVLGARRLLSLMGIFCLIL